MLAMLAMLPYDCNGMNAAYGSFRSDVFDKSLPESGTKDPTVGGRLHFTVLLNNSILDGLSSATVNGQELLNLDTSSSSDLTYIDWARVEHDPGASQVWISLHSRNAGWFQSEATFAIKLKNSKNETIADTVVKTDEEPPVTLSYLATRAKGREIIIHLHSSSTQTVSVSSILFDGQLHPVGEKNGEGNDIPPAGHAVFVLTLASPKAAATVWTAVIFASTSRKNHEEYATSAGDEDVSFAFGFGGRLPIERFPVMVWPHSSDCPLPGGNDENAAELKKLGVDSVFYKGKDFEKDCNGLNLQAAVESDRYFHVFTDAQTAKSFADSGNSSAVDAIFIGDEVDGSVDASHLRSALAKATAASKTAPSSLTYQGSKTTHNVGAFSGITDIQGSDAYAAACAPTMLAVTKTLPLQYPYFYLRNARDNHMPLPMWGYAQLYSDAWSYQANANELLCQMAQVVLSGSKALMFFQSEQKYFEEHKAKDIGDMISNIKLVAETIRTGDIQGMAFKASATLNKMVMVETIRSPDSLLVIVVNTDASGYSNLLCHTLISKHWTFNKQVLKSITLDLTSSVGVRDLTNWQEAKNGALVNVSDVAIQSEGGEVMLSDIALSDSMPARFFLASVVPTREN